MILQQIDIRGGLGRLTERVPNVLPNFGRMCARNLATSFTGECTEWPENIVVSKQVSDHALSEMVNYIEKLQCIVYKQK